MILKTEVVANFIHSLLIDLVYMYNIYYLNSFLSKTNRVLKKRCDIIKKKSILFDTSSFEVILYIIIKRDVINTYQQGNLTSNNVLRCFFNKIFFFLEVITLKKKQNCLNLNYNQCLKYA